MRIVGLFILCFTLTIQSAQALSQRDFDHWLANMRQEAIAAGIQPALANKALSNLTPIERAIKTDRNQAEVQFSFDRYLERVISDYRVQQGQKLYNQHRQLLDRIGREFGVQPRFIVALWGLETAYGKITGDFPIIQVLATLAFEGRREEFFKDELIKALKIVQRGEMDLERMTGSWAGAMGQSQFMPSSFLAYAVDYDGDGKRDIWNSLPDVFASIANYLKQRGWNDDLTWGREVVVPRNFDRSLEGRTVKRPMSYWQQVGVRKPGGADLPIRNIEASIVMPEGTNRVLMTYGNYDVLMKWNRSLPFATSVGKLSDAIEYRR